MKMPNMIDAKKRNNDKINYVNYNVSLDKFGDGKKFFVRTYGCQMNEHDSEKIKGMLKSVGYTECDSVDNADIVILNTCAIRENAHDKVFGFLGVLKHIKDTKNPDLLIGICGCMSQEKVVVDEILSKYKYVDFVCGTHNLNNLLNIIKDKIDNNTQQIEVLSYEGDVVEGVPVVRDSIYSAWVDIQYGCDKFCTYCIVPYTRGKQRSRTKESLDERKNITKKLREKCKVEEIKKMDYKELHEYITNMFVSNNKKITYNQVKEILNRCEYNDDLAINETEKLLLYKLGEDVITDDDIDKVVSKSSEKEIFTLSDAVMKKNLKQIFNSYNILIRSGIEPVVLIDNLARQFRTLYQVKILCKTMDEKEISRKLGLNPYVVKKAHENVNNYEEEELINNLYELSNLDIDIKVKGLDKYKVLENFFLKI